MLPRVLPIRSYLVWGVASLFIFACQSTEPFHGARSVAQSEAELNDEELLWAKRAEAIHAFMKDYYGNPRGFKARSVLGLSELQRVILKNRSEAWQPHLSDHRLRVSFVVDPNAGIQPYHWQFSKNWQSLLQKRVLSRRRDWSGSPGLVLWILPSEEWDRNLQLADHQWLSSLDVVATDPKGRFVVEEGSESRKLIVEEGGVYLETVLNEELRLKKRVSFVMNDVKPIEVDSSHRFLQREIASLNASQQLKNFLAESQSEAGVRDELMRHIDGERLGRRDSIEWIEKYYSDSNLVSAKKGFPGLWEAYLRGHVDVFNVPGLEYQCDPEFLSHIDALVKLYVSSEKTEPGQQRQPGSAANAEAQSRRALAVEYDDSGPVLGLFL